MPGVDFHQTPRLHCVPPPVRRLLVNLLFGALCFVPLGAAALSEGGRLEAHIELVSAPSARR